MLVVGLNVHCMMFCEHESCRDKPYGRSLQETDPYVLEVDGRVYLWQGWALCN